MNGTNHDSSTVIIIPALNEEKAIEQTIKSIPIKYKTIIVVDNGSVDQTYSIAKNLGVIVIKESRRGYGYACLAGINFLTSLDVRPSNVVFLDADGADNPKNIDKILDLKDQKPFPKMVMGSRMKYIYPGAMSAHAIVANKVLVALIRILYRTKLSDMGPLRVIDYETLIDINMTDTGYGWSSEMIVKCLKKGYLVQEIDVEYRPRIGKSKISGSVFVSLKAAIWLTIHILKHALRS